MQWDKNMEKYIVFTWLPTGSCWATYIKAFDTLEEAQENAKKHRGGTIIKTDYFEEIPSYPL